MLQRCQGPRQPFPLLTLREAHRRTSGCSQSGWGQPLRQPPRREYGRATMIGTNRENPVFHAESPFPTCLPLQREAKTANHNDCEHGVRRRHGRTERRSSRTNNRTSRTSQRDQIPDPLDERTLAKEEAYVHFRILSCRGRGSGWPKPECPTGGGCRWAGISLDGLFSRPSVHEGSLVDSDHGHKCSKYRALRHSDG
jgi:hypothetical protein